MTFRKRLFPWRSSGVMTPALKLLVERASGRRRSGGCGPCGSSRVGCRPRGPRQALRSLISRRRRRGPHSVEGWHALGTPGRSPGRQLPRNSAGGRAGATSRASCALLKGARVGVAAGAQSGLQRFHRQPGGDATARVPSHAVGDREDPEVFVDEEAVFVVVALAADVGRPAHGVSGHSRLHPRPRPPSYHSARPLTRHC